MTDCPRCGSNISRSDLSTLHPVECPICGFQVSPSKDSLENGGLLIRTFFSDVWEILVRPSDFFRRMPSQGGLSGPLCFALVAHWLGAALGFIWKTVIGNFLSGSWFSSLRSSYRHSYWDNFLNPRLGGPDAYLDQMRERAMDWFFGTSSVIMDPFLTLGSILFTAFFVFLGARLLVSPPRQGRSEEVTYESAVRLVAFGMTPSILQAIPVIGGFLAGLLILTATIKGAKQVYRVETGRAVIIALFPKLLFAGFLVMGVIFFMTLAFKFFMSFF